MLAVPEREVDGAGEDREEDMVEEGSAEGTSIKKVQYAPSSARCEERRLAKVDSRVATRPIDTDLCLVSASVGRGG